MQKIRISGHIPPLRLHHWLVIALIFFSFSTTWLVSDRIFEHLPHLEDEVAYLFQARVFARGDVVIKTPQPALAYWNPFVITDSGTGNKFGKYPLGYPVMMSIGLHLGGVWLIHAFANMLSVALTYKIGRTLFKPEVGLFGAGLLAFSPMMLLLSGTMMSHNVAICLFLIFVYSFMWIEKRRAPVRWGILAGLALGLLIINRPLTAVAVSLPFILWAGIKTTRALVLDGHGAIIAIDQWLDREDQSPHLIFKQLREAFMPKNVAHVWSISQSVKVLVPYICIAVLALLISRATPLFTQTATGDPNENLYLRVWSYDRLGFGEGYGRSGHTITKGVRHARFDLSLTAGDLFGWAIQRPRDDNGRFIPEGWQIADVAHPQIQRHLQENSNYYPIVGLSLFLLPIGLFFGLRLWWMRLWLLGGLFWLIAPLYTNAKWLEGDEATLWAWLLIGLGLFLAPIGVFILMHGNAMRQKRAQNFTWSLWTWLLLAVCVSLISFHLAYWVGSQRYSTRYYAEALPAFALIGGLGLYGMLHSLRSGLAWVLSKQADAVRYIVTSAGYAFILVLWLGSLYLYSTPRINALYRFNNVSPHMVETIQARATDDRPILVIVNGGAGEISWRAFGSLMAVTSPYLDSQIVVAWNYEPSRDWVRENILARFPDRQVIELNIRNTDAWFLGCDIAQDPACNLNPPPK